MWVLKLLLVFCAVSTLWSCRMPITCAKLLKCDPADEAALLSLASALPTVSSSWNTSLSCCTWASVVCRPSFDSHPNVTVSRVTAFAFWGRKSVGGQRSAEPSAPFPDAICNLTALRLLTLRLARLSGPLPDCIGTHLIHLRTLNLAYNSFSGPIPPSYASLRALQVLTLRGNRKLSGPLSSSIVACLPELLSLDLSDNSFSGPVPSFPSSPLLSSLTLSNNRLAGDLILFCSSSYLPSLKHLNLRGNALSGDIPPFASWRFPSLSHLELSDDSFNGSFPPSLCGLSTLTSLDLSVNAHSGSLDVEALQHCGRRLAKLQSLELSRNRFEGSLPPWIVSLPALQFLRLSHNSFNGTLPKLACTLSFLDLADNQFEGPFPPWIGSLSQLHFLDLSRNKFAGSLPQSWQNLSSLRQLRLSSNSIIDLEPPKPLLWVFRLPRLQSLSLDHTRLQPAHLGGCPSHEPLTMSTTPKSSLQLVLSSNNLTAKSLSCLQSLPYRSLDLFGNPLATSTDDPYVLNLISEQISTLNLGNCQLTGPIQPEFLERILRSQIWGLYMSSNSLTGEIPQQVCDCSNLKFVDFSFNLFSGVTPPSESSKIDEVESLKLKLLSDGKLAVFDQRGHIKSAEKHDVCMAQLHRAATMTRSWLNRAVAESRTGSLLAPNLPHNHTA